jgi:hypothetical protein
MKVSLKKKAPDPFFLPVLLGKHELMLDNHPPSFLAYHLGQLYQVCVTSRDFVCAALRTVASGKAPRQGAGGGGVLGAMGVSPFDVLSDDSGPLDVEGQIERMRETFDTLGADGIRAYVKETNRGFVINPKDLDEAWIDAVGKWKRLFFGRPSPALILNHRKQGKLVFVFRKKHDVVVGVYETDRLLGDHLAIALNLDRYRKAIRKYEKMR